MRPATRPQRLRARAGGCAGSGSAGAARRRGGGPGPGEYTRLGRQGRIRDVVAVAHNLDEHSLGAQGLDHVRDEHRRRALERPREAADVARLLPQVGFAAKVPPQFPHQGGGPTAAQRRNGRAGERRHPEQDAHVPVDLSPNPGAQDLDDHLAAVVQQGPVHLRHRGRGQGGRVEAFEEVVGWRSEGRLHGRCSRLRRKRAGVRLQPGQLRSPPVRQQVPPLAQRLAELDEGRAQPLQGPPQPHRKPRPRARAEALGCGRPQQACRSPADPKGTEDDHMRLFNRVPCRDAGDDDRLRTPATRGPRLICLTAERPGWVRATAGVLLVDKDRFP